MSKYILVVIMLLTAPAVFAGTPGSNAPAGTTELISNEFTTWDPAVFNQADGWQNNFPGADCFVVSDAAAPSSPPGVLRQHRGNGDTHGGCVLEKSFSGVPRVYGKIVYKHSNPFYGVASTFHKLTGYIGQTSSGGNFFRPIEFNGSGASSVGSIMGGHNNAFNGQANNCHLMGDPNFYNPQGAAECALVYGFRANLGASYSTANGVWHTDEFIMKLGTSPTNATGIYVVYHDGTRVSDWRNINHVHENWIAWRLTHTWDGQAILSPGTESWIDIDSLYLGTFPDSSAIPGGGNQPPIDQPPGPPGTVTGVTVTVQ